MIHQLDLRLYLLVGWATVALMAGAVSGSPVGIVAAAPALVALVVAAVSHRWPDVEVAVRAETPRVVEGDDVVYVVEVRSRAGVPWLEIDLGLPASLDVVPGSDRQTVHLPPNSGVAVRVVARARHWGVVTPGRVRLRARDRFGCFVSSTDQRADAPVRVHPSDRRLGALATPRRLHPRLGNHASPARGGGVDYADIRPLRRGDRGRDVNWRVTARRGQPWVNDHHPDRSTDVVLVADTLHAVGGERDSTLQVVLRAALDLADRHLDAQDRVGLLDLARRVRWFAPQQGRRQLHRLVDALLECEADRLLGRPGDASGLVGHVRSGTLVVGISALLTPDGLDVLGRLAARGHDVVLVECEPRHRLEPPVDPVAVFGRRWWELERSAARRRLHLLGVPTVPWDGDEALAPRLGQVRRVPGPVRGVSA